MTTKEKLLALLEENKGAFFSGEEIARTLQVSRAAVWKAVNALREDGYTIDAATNKGYRLSPDSDILSPQGIRRFLNPEYQDLDLTVLPTAPSTNALVREKANQGARRAASSSPVSRPPGGDAMGGSSFPRLTPAYT